VSVIANLDTNLRANTDHFDSALDKSGARLGKFRNAADSHGAGVEKATSAFSKLSGGALTGFTDKIGGWVGHIGTMVKGLGLIGGVALAAVAGVVGLGVAMAGMASHGAASMTAISGLSRQLGMSTESLAALGAMPGVDPEGMAHSIIHMQRGIADGSEHAAGALNKMGLSLSALQDMSAEDQLKAIYGAFGRIATQGDRASAAMALFGRQGIEMLGSLSRGTAGLVEGQRRAQEFGLLFTATQAAAVRHANITWGQFGMAMQGVSRQLAIAFLPLWESIGRVGGNVGRGLVAVIQDNLPTITALTTLVGAGFEAIGNAAMGAAGLVNQAMRAMNSSIGDLQGNQRGLMDSMARGWLTTSYVITHAIDGWRLAMRQLGLAIAEIQMLWTPNAWNNGALLRARADLETARRAFAVGMGEFVRNGMGEGAAQNQILGGGGGGLDTKKDAGAVEKGSKEAFSLINGKESQRERILRDQLQQQQRIAGGIDRVNNNLANIPVIRPANLG